MINNLLDLARLEQGGSQLHLQPESPTTLLRSGVRRLPAAGRRTGAWSCRNCGPAPCRTSDGRRRPVSARLAEPAGQRPGPHAAGRPHYPGRGGGRRPRRLLGGRHRFAAFPPNTCPSIFQRHFRVPGDAAPGGSGLGLAIVREIVAAHGGAVDCESMPGEPDRLPLVAAHERRKFCNASIDRTQTPPSLPRSPTEASWRVRKRRFTPKD